MRLTVLVILAAALVLGHLVRTWIGIDELSPTGIRAAVRELGSLGPALFFCLVVFRQFLAMPAVILLLAGGLCFGALVGTVLGAAGIVVSGALKFGVARWLGREWVRQRFGDRFSRIEERIDRMGPVLIGLSTAHPLGILAPIHWAAGLSSLSFASFVLALVLGAPVRTFALSTFGATLAEGSSAERWTIALVPLAVMLGPLAVPAVRRRLFAPTG